MIRIGGGGNDPRFLMWILIRAAPGLLLRILWYGITYWPRQLFRRYFQHSTRRVEPGSTKNV